MSTIPLSFTGPDRYCPECQRWLVHVHDDGSFDLAAEASLIAATEIVTVEDGVMQPLVVEAICLRCEPERATQT